MKNRLYFVILGILAVGVMSLFAPSANGITLTECVKEVLETNPRILEKLKYYNSVVHSREFVSRRRNLNINLEAGVGKQNVNNSSTRYKTNSNEVSGGRIVARKLLSDGNSIANEVSALDATARSALFSYIETANACIYETTEAYLNVLKQRELIALAIENIDVHSRLMSSIRERVESKTSGKSELERVQGRLAMAQSTLILRQNDYKNSVYKLHKLVGRFIDGSDLEVPFLSGSLIPSSLALAIQKQWEYNPNLIAADYNIVSKKHEVEHERRENRPDLYLEAYRDWRKNYSGLRGEDNESSVMLRLSVPIDDGGMQRDRIRRSKSLLHQEKHSRDNIARTVLNDLNLSYTGYKLLETQINALRKSLLFTKRALRSYQQEFKLGKRLLINILDAEVEYQNSRSQLAATKSDLLISKYRVLYSIGTIAEDMGLEIPMSEGLIEARRMRPATKDRLPIPIDFDLDGVRDRFDVSVNSSKNQVTNDMGETEEMTKAYLSEPVSLAGKDEFMSIRSKMDLQIQAIKPDVPVEIDFITFASGTEELSTEAKILMRELLTQLRRLAYDGQIKICVTTEGTSASSDAKLLALRRAWNLKKILTEHMLDPDSIVVEAREPLENEHPNSFILTIQSDLKNFGDSINNIPASSLYFAANSDEITNMMHSALQEMVYRLNKQPESAVDVVVYSNDSEDPAKDKAISLKRAIKLVSAMKEMGLTKEANPIAWGSYEAEIDLYAGIDRQRITNSIEFVTHN